jgi:hypothetical protein
VAAASNTHFEVTMQLAFSTLAQASQGSQGQAAGTIIFLAIMVIALVVGIAIAVALIYLVYNAQRALPVEHQKIPAGQVWLLLIPLFNLVWNFFVYPRVSASYQSYFESRGRTDVGDAGRGLGLGYAICCACSIIPVVGGFVGLAALVLWILFLVKIYGLKKQIDLPPVSTGFPVVPPKA